jgi:hypothetical protein
VVSQYITLGRVWSAIEIVLIISFMIAVTVIFFKFISNYTPKPKRSAYDDDDMIPLITWSVYGTTMFVSVLFLGNTLYELVSIWIAPKVWLLLELKHLITPAVS